MSTKKHHAEWLSLIEISGPFLTMPVLERVFPQGLDAHDAEGYRELRLAFEEWEEQAHKPAIHRAWLKYVLQQTLGLPDEVLAEGQAVPETLKAVVAEHGETLRPDFVVRNPADIAPPHQPRLLIQTYAPAQDLNKPVAERRWKASPATRMMELLHATDIKLGLVTNGEHWMLVYAPRGETTGYASWYASLWLEEKLTLQSFRSLLGVQRFFNVADNETLDELLKESAKHQQEVTDQLGYQVRRAVEVLIHSLDRADQDHGRDLLREVPPAELYEAALTVMMRLVFLFCAEERDLLLLEDPLYDESYAVSTLVAQLQAAADQHGEEVLERRNDAYVRLLATFRAVFGGIQHERLKLPAYGGRLFDPDRFPFLEGRAAQTKWRETAATPLPVNNRTVLHLLRSLQYLELQGEARRLSFRALDIEQIGHVYEGLLDHTAKRATSPVLGLVGPRGDEPEIALSELERQRAKGEDSLRAFLKEQTGKSDNALTRLLANDLELPDVVRLRAACGNDEALFKRVFPFGALIRPDSFDRPVVIPAGSVYVTAGTDRRSSGTHYTPRTLTEPIVQYTLEPLVYVGPAEGLPKEEWRLRSPRELLELKICDMACGSGAFLVQACRYLAERLVEAWDKTVGSGQWVVGSDAERASTDNQTLSTHDQPPSADQQLPTTHYPLPTPIRLTPYGEPATGASGEALIPLEDAERLAYAQRLIAQRCLYGVDKNHLAVEMAKLSLWLLTLAKDKPFTFLDHAIRCGDSLVGLHHWNQVRYFTLDLANPQESYFSGEVQKVAAEVTALRQRIEARPAEVVEDAEIQQQLLAEAEAKAAQLRYAADLLLSVEFRDANERQKEVWRHDVTLDAKMLIEKQSLADFKDAAEKALDGRQTFHWPIEFPEVFTHVVPPSSGSLNPPSLPPEGGTTNAGFDAGGGTGSGSDRVSVSATHATPESDPVATAPGTASASLATDHRPLTTGFDAIVCNPPFVGGQKITGNLGVSYRDYLVAQLARGKKGSADLCAYFFLQAQRLLKPGGSFGMIATNTIAQGDTREVGLDQMTAAGSVIYRAVPSQPWPGVAALEVAEVWLRNGEWRGACVLDGQPVAAITPFLTKPGNVTGKPFRLAANADKSFQGSIVLGMGFVLTPEEAQALIAKDARNREVLFPYLNGEDLNSRPDQSPSRWVINFKDWPLDRSAPGSWFKADEDQIKEWLKSGRVPKDYPDEVAADFPDCLAIVREKVKPERAKDNRKVYRDKWWQYAEKRLSLYETISGLQQVLICSEVTKHLGFTFSPNGIVYSANTDVLTPPTGNHFAILQSTLHETWARSYSSQLETRLKYSPGNAYETFPFPAATASLETIGEQYHAHRQAMMLARQEGLTKTYNRFHNPEETAADIVRLRALHQALDEAVAAAYGWTDLALGHDFHATKQGTRFTLSEPARREVLDRLLELNHRRYAEEVAAGLHEKGKKKAGSGERGAGSRKQSRASRTPKATPSLFGDEDGDSEPAPAPANHSLPQRAADSPLRRSKMLIETRPTAPPLQRSGIGQQQMPLPRSGKENHADSYKHHAPTERENFRNPQGRQRGALDERATTADLAALRPAVRPVPLHERETNEVMAALRRCARDRGWLERGELLRAVARELGYQRLSAQAEETLRNHLRAALRRGILIAEGPDHVALAARTMDAYSLAELREVFASVMRLGRSYDREEVIRAIAEHLGFTRLTDNIRQTLKSAINSGIRQKVLGYAGDVIWREE